VTELEVAEQDVRTWFCSMSRIDAPLGPVEVPLEVVATALVNLTVPKSAKGTREEPDSKSSTIHSASNSQRDGWPEKVWDTVFPVDSFVMVAVPPVLLDAFTVMVTVSPVLNEMPEKS
jgi:hypothetical protein